jgi:hypothetical protein
MGEELPKKEMPAFKIGKEQIDVLNTVSAVTNALANTPGLAEDIAEIFKEVAMEKDRELVKRVTELLATKVDVSPEKIKAAFDYWYIWYLPPEPSGRWITTGWYHYPRPFWYWHPESKQKE